MRSVPHCLAKEKLELADLREESRYERLGVGKTMLKKG
jgi:hypothetical protein